LSANKPGDFTIEAKDDSGPARSARLATAHGEILTPAFMPVGTAGTVKAIDPEELQAVGFRVILGNAFHLEMRPGSALIESLGGLHKFMQWPGAILTDSGGYQVFSLSSLRKISEDGVKFQSPINGAAHFFTPESATAIQRRLGSDIVMAFDECIPYPSDRDYTKDSTERTIRWLKRCMTEPLNEGQLLFGIVQGGSYEDLRRFSAEETAALDLPGHAIGGLSVGEPKPEMLAMLESAIDALPEDKPVYAMGVGTPGDFAEFIHRGIDMFDCVQPTRHARNGQLFTRRGTLVVKNAQYRDSQEPPDENCSCALCRRFTMAYLRHLYTSKEILAMRLMTLHNLTYFHDFTTACRDAIAQGAWDKFYKTWREDWHGEE